jgi:hypothetical protein
LAAAVTVTEVDPETPEDLLNWIQLVSELLMVQVVTLVVTVISELLPAAIKSIELTFTVSVFTIGFSSGVEPESELQAHIPKKAIPRTAKINCVLIRFFIF